LIFFLNYFSFLKDNLESQFKSIQIKQKEQLESQLQDLNYLQENIIIMVNDVEQIRTRLF